MMSLQFLYFFTLVNSIYLMEISNRSLTKNASIYFENCKKAILTSEICEDKECYLYTSRYTNSKIIVYFNDLEYNIDFIKDYYFIYFNYDSNTINKELNLINILNLYKSHIIYLFIITFLCLIIFKIIYRSSHIIEYKMPGSVYYETTTNK